MTRYPRFTELIADYSPRQLTRLASASGVTVEVICALAAGEHTAALADRMRLGAALNINPLELFALDPEVEAFLADVEPRFATDRNALEVIDR